jgi:hypothetical protein
MGNLKKIIESGDLSTPNKDSSELFENMTDEEITKLHESGEVVISDGKGTAFLIQIPPDSINTNKISPNSISIIKIPFAAKIDMSI